jgi:hypothetical protein
VNDGWAKRSPRTVLEIRFSLGRSWTATKKIMRPINCTTRFRGSKRIASTWRSFMRSCVLAIRTAFFEKVAHWRRYSRRRSRKIGIQTMKPFCGGDGIILKSGTIQNPIDCLHYALNLPTDVVITGIDKPEILDQAFQAAKTFKPLADQQFAALLAKTEQVARTGKYELFKVSAHFDGTAKHPDWLGGDDPAVQKLAPEPTS